MEWIDFSLCTFKICSVRRVFRNLGVRFEEILRVEESGCQEDLLIEELSMMDELWNLFLKRVYNIQQNPFRPVFLCY